MNTAIQVCGRCRGHFQISREEWEEMKRQGREHREQQGAGP